MTHDSKVWAGAISIAFALGLAAQAEAQTLRPQLDLATAQKMQAGCLGYARDKNLKVAIAIYVYSGRMISFAHMDGAPTGIAEVAQWKGRAAAIMLTSTADMAQWKVPEAPGVATVPGGLPLFDRQNNGLGGIGVSGAAVADDLACAQAGIDASGIARP